MIPKLTVVLIDIVILRSILFSLETFHLFLDETVVVIITTPDLTVTVNNALNR